VVIEALGSSAALDRGDLTTQVVPSRPQSNGDGTLITGLDAVTADSEYFNKLPHEPDRQRPATDRSAAGRRGRASELMRCPVVESLHMSWAVLHLGRRRAWRVPSGRMRCTMGT
jgi:hypothetical protein